MDLCIHTLFDKRDKPIVSSISCNNTTKIIELYRSGSKRTIYDVQRNINTICELFKIAIINGGTIKLSDTKRHIQAFELPSFNNYNKIYDFHLPEIKATNPSDDHRILAKITEHLASATTKDYQNIIARASEIYLALENRGLLLNYDIVYPKWYLDTYSGRSKTTEFCIQGYTHNDVIRCVNSSEDEYLLHFDWISADVRVASILSNDAKLQYAFEHSDPYTYMMSELSNKLDRSQCKLLLLKAINSLDLDSPILDLFPNLKDWLCNISQKLARNEPVYTLMGRKFAPQLARNKLSALNGVMQGTVAHAMQLSMCRIWDKIGNRIVAETHDSLVVCARQSEIVDTIGVVSNVMFYPFAGYFNYSFPLKVSIGYRWRDWSLHSIIREKSIEHVQTIEEITAQAQQREIDLKKKATQTKN